MPQPSKRRLQEIDDTIEQLTETLKRLKRYNGYSSKCELEFSLMTAKLKREKLKAMAAVAESQRILDEMDAVIAESDLYYHTQQLKNSKKIKLDDRNKEKSSSCKCKSDKSASKSVKSSPNIKEKSTSGRQEREPVIYEDSASEDTVIVEPLIVEKTEPVMDISASILSTALSGQSQVSTEEKISTNKVATDGKTSTDVFSQADNGILKQAEAFLSNSMYAEFNTPYSKNNSFTPELKIKPKGKKSKSSKKSKSKDNVKNNVNNSSQNNMLAVKGIFQPDNITAMMPVHHNMPLVITQPKRHGDETPCTSRPSEYYQARPIFDVQSLFRPTHATHATYETHSKQN